MLGGSQPSDISRITRVERGLRLKRFSRARRELLSSPGFPMESWNQVHHPRTARKGLKTLRLEAFPCDVSMPKYERREDNCLGFSFADCDQRSGA
jgi:hypothetical protein